MISDKNPYNNWNGNGSTTTFDFDFYIEDETQLTVLHTNSKGVQTLLKYGTDYSINELQNENGSFINFPLASSAYGVLSEDEVISLCLTLPITQENPYSKSSYLNLETLEYSLDYLTRICQILERKLNRSIKIEEGALKDFDLTMPLPVADMVLQWNSEGKRLINYNVKGQVESANSNATNALSNSNIAIDTANSAKSKADNAISISNVADEKADIAVSVANKSNEKANNAINVANSADEKSDNAIETATHASNKVDEFGISIQEVIKAAEKIDELSEAVEEAKTSADTAVGAANIATTAAQNATETANTVAGALETKQDVITDLEEIRAGIGTLQTKQDIITDLEQIRTGAALGATSIQDVSDKLDLNASNLDTEGKSYISCLSLPSSKYTTLTVGASGTSYTAPANGWFACDFGLKQTSASGIMWAKMVNKNTGYAGDLRFFTNGTEFEYQAIMPVKKGDVMVISYQASSVYLASWEYGLRFVYAKGEIE